MPSDASTAKPSLNPVSHSRIIGVVLAYAVLAGLWILLSDKLVGIFFSNPQQILLASMFKGWLFVAVTSALLYGLMLRMFGGGEGGDGGMTRLPILPFLLLAGAILAITGIGIVHTMADQQEKEVARLQAIADLKTRQIGDWLAERQGDAEFVKTSIFFAEQYQHWSASFDPDSGELFRSRLLQFIQIRKIDAASLVDPQGKRIWGSDEAPRELAPALWAALESSIRDRAIRRVGPYRGVAGHVRLDFIAPLANVDGPPPFVILHINPARWLFPMLQAWPVPSASGEAVLFRRDGDHGLYLNELRHAKDSAAKLRLPVAQKELLAARVLRGEARQGETIIGNDYRGVPVLGVVHPMAGTDWFLLAKIDRSELNARFTSDAAWMALVGLLALFVVGAGFHLLRQGQQLALGKAVQQSQEERLRALNLLAAIAEGSDDAIFAKDLEGRYILFNRAASQFVGKPVDEVLGRDDHAIFPAEQAEWLMALDRQMIAENQSLAQEERLDTAGGERVFHSTKGSLRDAAGKVIGVFGVSRDITERKLAELALQDSEQRFRQLFDLAPIPMAIVNQDGVVVALNQQFTGTLGYTLDDVSTVDEWWPLAYPDPDYRLWVMGTWAATMEGAAAVDAPVGADECRITCKDGRERTLLVSGAKIGTDMLATFYDITERKRAEAELWLWAQAFEHAHFGLVIVDARSNTFLAVNPAFARQRGYSPQDLVGQPIMTVYSAERVEEIMNRIKNLDATSHGVFESEHIRKDGSRFPVMMDVTVIKSTDGKPLTRVAYALDITERRAAEASLREQTQELAQRNAELERFNRAMVGREVDMIVLKQQVNALSRLAGEEPPYPLAFLDDESSQPKPDGQP